MVNCIDFVCDSCLVLDHWTFISSLEMNLRALANTCRPKGLSFPVPLVNI